MSERKAFGVAGWGLLALLPLAMLLLFSALQERNGPYFLGVNSDPDYAYLLNALAVRNGQSPHHWDHPGATVQALGGLTLRAMTPTLSGEDAAAKLVADPETPMRSLVFVLTLLNAALIAWAGVIVARALQNIWAGIFFQAVPFFNGVLWEHVVRYMPDMLAFSLALLFVALVLRFAVDDPRGKAAARSASVLGFVFGLVLATKITGAALGFLAVALFRKDWRAYCYFAVGGGLGAIPVVVFVNHNDFKNFVLYFARWIFLLTTRQGAYGSGATGLPSVAKIWSGLLVFCVYVPAFMLVVALAGAAVFSPLARRIQESIASSKLLRLARAGVAICALQVLFMTKQVNQRYLIPAFAISALAMVLVALPWLSARRKGAGAALAGLALCVALAFAFAWTFDAEAIRTRRADWAEIDRKAAEMGCEMVPTYRSTSLPFALAFGNIWTGYKFSDALLAAHPSFLMLDPSEGFLDIARRPVTREALVATGKKYCIRVFNITELPVPTSLASGFHARPILSTSQDDSLFLVDFSTNETR